MKHAPLPLFAALALTAAFPSPLMAHEAAAPDCAVSGDIEMAETEGHSERITVKLAGKPDGPDVVLIPGLATPRSVWDDTVRGLAGCYRLHLVQVRGFGDAPGANAEGSVLDPLVATVADYVDDAIIDMGRAKPKIIGHSFGGLTAMKIGLAIPEKVEEIMVVDALPFFGVLFGPDATAEQIKPQAEVIRSAMQAAPEPGLDANTLRTMSRSKAGRDQVLAWAKQSDVKVSGQVFYEVMTTDIRTALKENKVPLTMLYPINPHSPFPAEMTENVYKGSYSAVPGAKLRRIDDSAHFIMLDQPEKFHAEVAAFLSNKEKGEASAP